MSKNAARIDDLTARMSALEARNHALEADVKTLMRHYQTLGRNLRRVLADNRELRMERIRSRAPVLTDAMEPRL